MSWMLQESMTFYYYIIFEGEWLKRSVEVILIVSFYYGSREFAGIECSLYLMSVLSYIVVTPLSLSYVVNLI